MMAHKLENPARVMELNPKGTLIKIGLSEGATFCDVGAGTGIFTYAAAEITANNIYAVEIAGDMREILREKNNVPNVVIEDSVQNVPANSCNVVLLCTVLHELDDIPAMLREIKRIQKPDGILAIIEFHKTETPMGPPVSRRISEEDASRILTENGLEKIDSFLLGENLYCLVARQI